jgi:hypothetical protein
VRFKEKYYPASAPNVKFQMSNVGSPLFGKKCPFNISNEHILIAI